MELSGQRRHVAVVIYQGRRNLIYLPILRDRKSAPQLVEYRYRASRELVCRYLKFQALQIHGHALARYALCGRDIFHVLCQIALTKSWYMPFAPLKLLYRHRSDRQVRFDLKLLQLRDLWSQSVSYLAQTCHQ